MLVPFQVIKRWEFDNGVVYRFGEGMHPVLHAFNSSFHNSSFFISFPLFSSTYYLKSTRVFQLWSLARHHRERGCVFIKYCLFYPKNDPPPFNQYIKCSFHGLNIFWVESEANSMSSLKIKSSPWRYSVWSLLLNFYFGSPEIWVHIRGTTW